LFFAADGPPALAQGHHGTRRSRAKTGRARHEFQRQTEAKGASSPAPLGAFPRLFTSRAREQPAASAGARMNTWGGKNWLHIGPISRPAWSPSLWASIAPSENRPCRWGPRPQCPTSRFHSIQQWRSPAFTPSGVAEQLSVDTQKW